MISQFKNRRALKKLRKKRLQKKNANIRKQLNKHRNSPKRRLVGDLGVEYQRGVAQESIQTKISPAPINQEKV